MSDKNNESEDMNNGIGNELWSGDLGIDDEMKKKCPIPGGYNCFDCLSQACKPNPMDEMSPDDFPDVDDE